MAYNILIVDDSAIIRTAIKRILLMTNLDLGDVYEAENGAVALQKFEDHWVDIVFADINMPVMNGIEMIDRMAESGILESTPVVIVSTEQSSTRLEQLKDKGIKAYLHKPFSPEKISAVVEEILNKEKIHD